MHWRSAMAGVDRDRLFAPIDYRARGDRRDRRTLAFRSVSSCRGRPGGLPGPGHGIETVGCGFDASPESYRALAWAAPLVRTVSARLHVLSVYEPTLPVAVGVGGGLPIASSNEVLRRQLEEELGQAISALNRDIDVEASLVDGDARELLVRASADLDLLVVGSRGYGPPGAVLLRSVSTALVRSAQSPLVVVPRGADAGSAR
jgi:nucleotide-binding universal stress UspA family protein